MSEIEKKYQELLKTLSPEQEEVITEYCNANFSSGADTEKFFCRLRIKDGLNLKSTVKSTLEICGKITWRSLKENRIRCQMTQEFVAETIGVSRQSVSKWEPGISDPNTSNLIALARLYGISAEELLKSVEENQGGSSDIGIDKISK